MLIVTNNSIMLKVVMLNVVALVCMSKSGDTSLL
jgi:hypothetical protein